MEDSKRRCCETDFIYNDTTEFYADSVEWCPFSYYADYLACGTYQLEETEAKTDETQTRKGGVALYQLIFAEKISLKKVYSYNSSGVLDMRWCFYENCPHLVVACSNGQVLLLKLIKEENSVSLKLVSSQTLSEDIKNITFSVDLSSASEISGYIVASDTSGSINYLKAEDSTLSLLKRWKAHNFESWICAFDYAQHNVIYSGGDDCCFKGWDLRGLPSSTFVNRRHTMGVTAISKSRKKEHLLVTGSYDENIFLWDTRSIKSPLSEVSVGGGIWRLKWHPYNPHYFISASMHNGFHLLSLTNDSLDLVCDYKKHESLAYGVDWCWMESEDSSNQPMSNYVASCSFYDKLLHLWKINF